MCKLLKINKREFRIVMGSVSGFMDTAHRRRCTYPCWGPFGDLFKTYWRTPTATKLRIRKRYRINAGSVTPNRLLCMGSVLIGAQSTNCAQLVV